MMRLVLVAMLAVLGVCSAGCGNKKTILQTLPGVALSVPFAPSTTSSSLVATTPETWPGYASAYSYAEAAPPMGIATSNGALPGGLLGQLDASTPVVYVVLPPRPRHRHHRRRWMLGAGPMPGTTTAVPSYVNWPYQPAIRGPASQPPPLPLAAQLQAPPQPQAAP